MGITYKISRRAKVGGRMNYLKLSGKWGKYSPYKEFTDSEADEYVQGRTADTKYYYFKTHL